MSKWNPSNPRIAGSEWYGSTPAIVQATKALGVGVRGTAINTESVDTIEAIIQGGANPPRLALDVYDLANPLFDVEEVVIAIPAANFSNGPGWVKGTGGVFTAYDGTAHNNIDDVVGETDPINTGATTQLVYAGIGLTSTSQIMFQGPTPNIFDGDTGAGGASYAGKRINAVTVLAIAENADDTGNVRFDGFVNIGGTRYASDTGPIVMKSGAGLARCRFTWYYNPVTGRPWCEADVDALSDGTDGFGIGVVTKNKFGNFQVTTVNLRIHVQPERRLATGFGNGAGGDQYSGFALVSTVDHATPAAWAKAAGQQYLLLFTATNRGGAGRLFAVTSGAVRDHEGDGAPGSSIASVPIAGGGARPNAAAPALGVGQLNVLMLSSGVATEETNPYADVIEYRLGGGPDALASVMEQQISTETTDQYGMAFVLVAVDGNGAGGALQNDSLAVEIAGAASAGPVEVSPDDVPADGKYHVVKVGFDVPASLGAGDPVVVRLTSFSTVGWRVPLMYQRSRLMLATDPFSLVAVEAGIGGSTDSAGFGDATADFPWAIVTAPDPPATGTLQAGCRANLPGLSHIGVMRGFSPDMPWQICWAALTWDPTALGGDFAYYEVQRTDLDGTWRTIAKVTTEENSYLNDIECLRNANQEYRVRVVRSDGAFSTWLDLGSFGISLDTNPVGDEFPPHDGSCDVVLASNFAPFDSFALKDLGGIHAWSPRQAQSPTYVELFGRDDPVGFFGLEDGGESFTRDLAIAFNDSAVGDSLQPDRAMFDVLITLLHNRTLPYVCYLDSWGRRWYASPAATTLQRTEPGLQYRSGVTFTQVARVPAVYTTDTPWAP